MKKPPAIAPQDDGDLFEHLFSDATRLRAHDRVVHPRPKRKPIPLQHSRDARDDPADNLSDHVTSASTASGDELTYLRNGLSRQTHRKLRRGHWKVDAELDLHGQRAAGARGLLVEFLNECLTDGARCVRIIHGKGLRSAHGEPVLKTRVANWLIQRNEVLAFCQARQSEGGGGAVVVLLLKKGSSDED